MLDDSGFTLDLALPEPEESVRLGLRPSECRVVRSTEQEADGTVILVEPLGSHTDVIVDVGGHQFVVRENGFASVEQGERVHIVTTEAVRHVFDPVTGERLATT